MNVKSKPRTEHQRRVYLRATVIDIVDRRPNEMFKLQIEDDPKGYLTPGNSFAQELRDFIEFVHNDGSLDPLDSGVVY